MNRYLNSLRDSIDEALDKYLPSEKEEPKTIHRAMRYSVFSRRAKRIRPILAIESCRACGGRLKDILPAAVAIELVHTYSLIHDDLPAMDDDDYRRGKPTSHKIFGEANAILAGDALLTLSFNIISRRSNSRAGLSVIRELSDAIGSKGMVGGQAMDLGYKDRRKDKGRLDYTNRLKTGRLFEASTRIGAIVAEAGERKVSAMARFGAYLGMAFQIIDDIIDGGDYMRLFGIAKSDRDSRILIKRAKGVLRIFGKRSNRLKSIADYILERTS